MDYSQRLRHAHLNPAMGRTCRSISQGGKIKGFVLVLLHSFSCSYWFNEITEDFIFASAFKQDIKFVTQEKKNKDLGLGLLIKSRHYGIWNRMPTSCEIVWNTHRWFYCAFFNCFVTHSFNLQYFRCVSLSSATGSLHSFPHTWVLRPVHIIIIFIVWYEIHYVKQIKYIKHIRLWNRALSARRRSDIGHASWLQKQSGRL